jgi:hypothetical protein
MGRLSSHYWFEPALDKLIVGKIRLSKMLITLGRILISEIVVPIYLNFRLKNGNLISR